MVPLNVHQIISSMFFTLQLKKHDDCLLLLARTSVHYFNQIHTWVTTFCQPMRLSASQYLFSHRDISLWCDAVFFKRQERKKLINEINDQGASFPTTSLYSLRITPSVTPWFDWYHFARLHTFLSLYEQTRKLCSKPSVNETHLSKIIQRSAPLHLLTINRNLFPFGRFQILIIFISSTKREGLNGFVKESACMEDLGISFN